CLPRLITSWGGLQEAAGPTQKPTQERNKRTDEGGRKEDERKVWARWLSKHRRAGKRLFPVNLYFRQISIYRSGSALPGLAAHGQSSPPLLWDGWCDPATGKNPRPTAPEWRPD